MVPGSVIGEQQVGYGGRKAGDLGGGKFLGVAVKVEKRAEIAVEVLRGGFECFRLATRPQAARSRR